MVFKAGILPFTLLVLSASAVSSTSYNEMFDSELQFRRPYRVFMHRYPFVAIPEPQDPIVDALTRGHPLKDKIKILPIPLVLDQNEYQKVIKAGIEQRMAAFRELFKDIILGEGRVFSEIPGFTLDLVKRMTFDESFGFEFLKQIWKKRTEDSINFPSGSDLIRNSSGKLVILEDNLGANLGGTGDFSAVRNAYLKAHSPDFVEGPDDLRILIQKFLDSKGVRDSKTEVLAILEESPIKKNKKDQEDDSDESTKDPFDHDLEDERRRSVIQSLEIPIIQPSDLTANKIKKIQKSGIKVILNFDVPDAFDKAFQFWTELFQNTNIEFLSAPGTVWMSNKALLVFADQIIQYYLNEEPILGSPETKLLDWRNLEDFKIPPFELEHPAEWVVKKANGCQGSSVSLLNFFSKEGINEKLKNLQLWRAWQAIGGRQAPLQILQRYQLPSIIPSSRSANSWTNFYVDIRPITLVSGKHIFVADQPWSRAISTLGDGLNNVSRGAFELPVFVQDCNQALRRLRH